MSDSPHTECAAFKQEIRIKMGGIEEKLDALDKSADNQIAKAINTEKDIVRLEGVISALKDKMSNFVSKDEFSPIRALVYGMVGMALTGVLSAVLAKIVTK